MVLDYKTYKNDCSYNPYAYHSTEVEPSQINEAPYRMLP